MSKDLMKMSLAEIIEGLKTSLLEIQSNRKKLIIGLMYLKETKRYKEDARFAKASFKTFLQNTFPITIESFNKGKYAWFSFPEETEKYGEETVLKILSNCGKKQVSTVLDAIKKKEKSLKKTMTQRQIEAVIKPFERIRQYPKVNGNEKKYRQMYNEQIKVNKALDMENKELKAQIEKLKEQLSVFHNAFTEAQKDPMFTEGSA